MINTISTIVLAFVSLSCLAVGCEELIAMLDASEDLPRTHVENGLIVEARS